MSSKPTPQELEAERQKLLASARAEKADPAKAAAGLDALLAGDVKPLGVDPPELGGRKKPWWLVGVGVIALALLWWLLGRTGPVAPLEPQPPAAVVDAAVAPVEVVDAGALDAATEPVEPFDAGGVADAGSLIDAGVSAKPKVPAEEVDTLAAELAMLDEARGALKTSPARALSVLDRYAKKFPRGSLELEASLVRVEALFALGRRGEAQKLVEKLRKRDSGGLLEERLKRLERSP